MSTFENIPDEVHAMITELLINRKDLNNLCKVSKRIYEKTVPYLYKSISLYALEEDIEDVGAFSLKGAGDRGILGYTRDLKVWSPIRTKLYRRCMHADQDKYDIYGEYDTYEDKTEDEVEDLAEELNIVFRGFELGAIRSLDWAMGTCVPHSLLGPAGYFSSKQENVEFIRLVTDGSCQWNEERGYRLDLGAFPHLKRLSWTGLSTQVDFDSLGDVLNQKSHQLEDLEIDLTYHHQLSDSMGFDSFDGTDDVFAAEILRVSSRTTRRFPLLKRLALTSVSFTPGETKVMSQRALRRIYSVFDFSSLQSLKLQHCQGWQDLIGLLNKRDEPLKLRSLELQWSFNNDPFEPHEELVLFLQKFQGLEELFLSTTAPADSLEIWRAALHHRATLRRFVHHQRTIQFDEDEGDDEREVDSPDLSFLDSRDVEQVSADCLGRLDLTSLGLCCIPRFMQSFVSGFASKTSLQILHMRQSGPDLKDFSSWAKLASEDDLPFDFAGIDLPVLKFPMLGNSFVEFAQWVFGPTGIQSLRLLAYGDFSYDGRFAHTTLLLCRRDAPRSTSIEDENRRLRFRAVVEEEDAELWELYEREKHALVACPCDKLFHG